MRVRPSTVIVLALLVVGCGETAEDTVVTPSPTTTAPTTTATDDSDDGETDEATEPDDAADEIVPGSDGDPVCPGYLDLLDLTELGIDDFRDAALAVDAPDAVFAAIATFEDPDADIEDFFGASDTIDAFALGRCADRFGAALVPASSDEAALTVLREAIEAGDEAAAATVAPTDVLVRLRPWDGYPADADTSYDVLDQTLTATLEPTVTLFCRAEGGVVVSCAFGE